MGSQGKRVSWRVQHPVHPEVQGQQQFKASGLGWLFPERDKRGRQWLIANGRDQTSWRWGTELKLQGSRAPVKAEFSILASGSVKVLALIGKDWDLVIWDENTWVDVLVNLDSPDFLWILWDVEGAHFPGLKFAVPTFEIDTEIFAFQENTSFLQRILTHSNHSHFLLQTSNYS